MITAQQTLYTKMFVPRQTPRYVSRWTLKDFGDVSDIQKVVDNKVREVLLDRVKRFNGNVKEAFADNDNDPILMYSSKKIRVPIRHVRVWNDMVKELVEIRQKAFVQTRNNYVIAFYGNAGERQRRFETVSFFEAARRSLAHQPVVQPSLGGLPLLSALRQKDIVARYDKDPDEINWDSMDDLRPRLFRVREFSVNGKIILDYLYAAKLDKNKDRNVLFYQANPNTLRCVAIEVDLLGRILKKERI